MCAALISSNILSLETHEEASSEKPYRQPKVSWGLQSKSVGPGCRGLLAVLALEPVAPRMQLGLLSLLGPEALVPLGSRCRQGLALGQLLACV